MILVEDGKCTVCGNRNNVVSLNDHSDDRTVTIICKDCLIDVLMNYVLYGDMRNKAVCTIEAKDINITRIEKAEKEITNIIFDNIDSVRQMRRE